MATFSKAVLQLHHVRASGTRLAVRVLVGVDEELEILAQSGAVKVRHALGDLVTVDQFVALGIEALDAYHSVALLYLRLDVSVDAQVASFEVAALAFVEKALLKADLTLALERTYALVEVAGRLFGRLTIGRGIFVEDSVRELGETKRHVGKTTKVIVINIDYVVQVQTVHGQQVTTSLRLSSTCGAIGIAWFAGVSVVFHATQIDTEQFLGELSFTAIFTVIVRMVNRGGMVTFVLVVPHQLVGGVRSMRVVRIALTQPDHIMTVAVIAVGVRITFVVVIIILVFLATKHGLEVPNVLLGWVFVGVFLADR